VWCKKQTMSKTKIIYIYDAICGWCFGFSPVMARFAEEYKGKVDIDVVSGGLKLGKGAGPIGIVAPYIKHAYLDVERASGVKFGERFVHGGLKDGTLVLNSLPPAIALSIMKEKYPENALKFTGILHTMIYVDGVDPENVDAYGAYAAKLGYDSIDFTARMRDTAYTEKANRDFEYAASLGVHSFPTLFVEANGKVEKLLHGYVPYEKLKAIFDGKLAEIELA